MCGKNLIYYRCLFQEALGAFLDKGIPDIDHFTDEDQHNMIFQLQEILLIANK